MNVLHRTVVGIAGIVVVGLALALSAPRVVHAVVSTLVTVSNTSGNPVPTVAVDTRNVNVVNTPNVNISSLPAVQLNGNVNATVTNALDSNNNSVPLITEDPAVQTAFNAGGACIFAGAPACLGRVQVPSLSNSVVVIQSVSGSCTELVPGTQISDANVTVAAPGEGPAPIEILLAPLISVGAFATQNFAENITAYSTSGPALQVSFNATTPQAQGTVCDIVVSGYLASK